MKLSAIKTLKTVRTLALGTATLGTAALILLAGLTYTLGTVTIAIALAAHDQATQSPLMTPEFPESPLPSLRDPVGSPESLALMLPESPLKPLELLEAPEIPESLGILITPYRAPLESLESPESPLEAPESPESPEESESPLKPLKNATMAQLRSLVRDIGGLSGSNRMKKAQLVTALETLGYTHI